MILEPKSKPVKFRIRSGGEEHSSLDSLCKNFVWEDIRPLCGSGMQLEKWLDRIDADVATQYRMIENPANNVLDIFNVLCRQYKSFLTTKTDAFKEYIYVSNGKKRGEDSKKFELNSLRNLCLSLIPQLTHKDLMFFAENIRSLFEIFEAEFINLVKRDWDVMTHKELFSIGKVLFESGRNRELAEEMIRESSSKGGRIAAEFIKKNFKEDRNSAFKKFYELFSTMKVIDALTESWNLKKDIKNIQGYTEEEKSIFSFSNACMSIFRTGQGAFGVASREKLYLEAQKHFDSSKVDDPLYEEKIFVTSLVDPVIESALERLKTIENYPPAKYLLVTRSFVLEDRKFEIGSAFGNANNLDVYVLKLMRFRQQDFLISGDYHTQELVEVKAKESSDDLMGLYNDKSIIECLRNSWENKRTINPANNRGLKNKLFMFSDACLNILKASWSHFDINNLSRIAEGYIGEIKSADPLRLEKTFVLALFSSNFDKAWKRLTEIADSYPPAAAFDRGKKLSVSLRGHSYTIMNMCRHKNANELEYFVNNLPNFRKYGKYDK